MIILDPDWKDDAACVGMPITVFFPKLAVGRNAERRNADLFSEAMATCARCPVRSECLADAMRHERGRPKRSGGA